MLSRAGTRVKISSLRGSHSDFGGAPVCNRVGSGENAGLSCVSASEAGGTPALRRVVIGLGWGGCGAFLGLRVRSRRDAGGPQAKWEVLAAWSAAPAPAPRGNREPPVCACSGGASRLECPDDSAVSVATPDNAAARRPRPVAACCPRFDDEPRSLARGHPSPALLRRRRGLAHGGCPRQRRCRQPAHPEW